MIITSLSDIIFGIPFGISVGFLGQVIGPAMGLAGSLASSQAQLQGARINSETSIRNKKLDSTESVHINASQINQRAEEDLRGRMRQAANAQTAAIGEMVRGFQNAFLKRQM